MYNELMMDIQHLIRNCTPQFFFFFMIQTYIYKLHRFYPEHISCHPVLFSYSSEREMCSFCVPLHKYLYNTAIPQVWLTWPLMRLPNPYTHTKTWPSSRSVCLPKMWPYCVFSSAVEVQSLRRGVTCDGGLQW